MVVLVVARWLVVGWGDGVWDCGVDFSSSASKDQPSTEEKKKMTKYGRITFEICPIFPRKMDGG